MGFLSPLSGLSTKAKYDESVGVRDGQLVMVKPPKGKRDRAKGKIVFKQTETGDEQKEKEPQETITEAESQEQKEWKGKIAEDSPNQVTDEPPAPLKVNFAGSIALRPRQRAQTESLIASQSMHANAKPTDSNSRSMEEEAEAQDEIVLEIESLLSSPSVNKSFSRSIALKEERIQEKRIYLRGWLELDDREPFQETKQQEAASCPATTGKKGSNRLRLYRAHILKLKYARKLTDMMAERQSQSTVGQATDVTSKLASTRKATDGGDMLGV